jgi:pilus assembly protein FimV
VQKGETLRKIAEETKPSDVSLEQMLVALYRENQAAFAGNNMNRLKAGQILKVPSSEQVAAITRGDANKEYRTQVNDWRQYREQLAGGVAAIPARPESTASASGRVGTAAVTPPAPPAADSKEVLKLSKSEAAGKSGAGAGKGSAQDRANALQEEVIAKDKALKESQSRVAALEGQIRDMQRLLELKGGAPATAAKPGDTKVAAAPTPPAPAKVEPTAPPAAAKPADPPKPAEVKPAEAPKTDTKLADVTKPGEPAKADATKPGDAAKPAEAPKVADASKPADTKPAPPKTDAKAAPKKAAPPPPPDHWYDNTWMLAAAGGGLLALGIGAFMFMRRRRATDYEAPNSAMTSAFPSDLKPGSNTSKQPTGGGLVDTGNSSFLTDFDKTGPGSIDTDEVDPVAEAEVYIAYGRDAQAEEILKEAMARDRGRTEIPLKLLEIYHSRKSATAFETVAKELKAQVGEDSPQWQKAAAMGSQIDPNNPLYGGATSTAAFPAAALAPSKPDVDFDIAGSTGTNQAAAPAPDFDLDLDGKPDTPHASSSSSIDFDLAPSAPAPAADAPKEEKSSFDFDLSSLDFPGGGGGKSDLDLDSTKSGSSNIDLADLSLDPHGDAGAGGEAVGTKLELAKAYLEIGDKDGAREILQEVAKEGSAAQREEAARLIGSL